MLSFNLCLCSDVDTVRNLDESRHTLKTRCAFIDFSHFFSKHYSNWSNQEMIDCPKENKTISVETILNSYTIVHC